ncbi:MAG TPA: winged helix-turn-helix domain-containing protein [Candidatus Polarisedimenticolia bacterium]|nr:winged helix-turn-helix domain-containing protein [Candidatus Polarisedimenticolia bacterium]
MGTATRYKFDEFEADLRAAELRKSGVRLKLQLQPFQVLVALLERPKEVVTREELRQRLWPEDTFVDFDHGLNTAMVKLRDVLGDSASKPKFIETIAKRGYRFLGSTEVVSDQPAAPEAKRHAQPEALLPPVSNPTVQPASLSAEVDSALPRTNRNTARLLFTLAQIMYLIFYLSALFRWENTYQASFNTWGRAGSAAFVVYMASSMVGLAVRLYLISATAMDYHLLGSKYHILTPALFVLDMIWALSPLLIADRIGLGFALGACAALVYMPFAQRTLMKMMQSGR